MEADLPMQQLSEMFNVNHFIISQANAHAAMLASFNVNKSVWSNRFMGLMTGVLLFLKKQVKEWLTNMIDLIGGQRIAPMWATRRGLGSQLFTQDYEGRDIDISLIPWINHRSIFSALLHAIYNPTPDEFSEWVKAAERETWRYIPKIKSHVAVEMTLDKCVQHLRKQVLAESLEKKQLRETAKMSNRVPSFFTSASLVNLGGLGITDRHNLGSDFDHTNTIPDEEKSQPSTGEIPVDVPTGWKGMGLRGNFSSGSLNRTGSGLFLMDRDSEDDMSTTGASIQKQVPGEVPSTFSSENIPLHHEGYIKTSSMANFYYKKSSHGNLVNALTDKDEKGENECTSSSKSM